MSITSSISDLLGLGSSSLETMSTLSPEQQKMMTALGDYLSNAISNYKGYTGKVTSGQTDAEQLALSKALENLSSGLSSSAQSSLSAYQDALKGLSEKDVYDRYMKYTAPSENAYLKNTLIPTFKESQVAGGTLRSTGTEKGIGDVISNFGNEQLSRIGEQITSERQRATSALSLADTINNLEKGTSDISTAYSMGTTARTLANQEFAAEMAKFYADNPDMQSILSDMMQYLGVNTQAVYTQEDPWTQFLGSAMGAVGSYLGSAAASGA